MTIQLVKSTCQVDSLSSGTCHRKWDLSPTKKIKKKVRIASASEKVFKRLFGPFLRVVVCLKAVFWDGQDVKYDRDITPRPHLFHGTNSHEVTQVVHR